MKKENHNNVKKVCGLCTETLTCILALSKLILRIILHPIEIAKRFSFYGIPICCFNSSLFCRQAAHRGFTIFFGISNSSSLGTRTKQHSEKGTGLSITAVQFDGPKALHQFGAGILKILMCTFHWYIFEYFSSLKVAIQTHIDKRVNLGCNLSLVK